MDGATCAEVYSSPLQREILTPNDSADLRGLELRIEPYEGLDDGRPKPFEWKFTKNDLFDLLRRIAIREAPRGATAATPPMIGVSQ